MPLIQFSQKLSVGIPQFDGEHQQLVALMNELFDAAVAGRGKDALSGTLEALLGYTRTHFANEERHMLLSGYPEYAAHKAQHDALAREVQELRARTLGAGSTAASMDLLRVLERWIVSHIQGSDAKYGTFLRAQGRT